MLIVTDSWIKKNTMKDNSSVCAINSSQAKILNLEWSDITSGWKEKVIGTRISDVRAELFVLLRGVSGKKNQIKVIESFKKRRR